MSKVVDIEKSDDKRRMYLKYYKYILSHVCHVVDNFYRYMYPLLHQNNISRIWSDEDIHNSILDLQKHILQHDASKLEGIEFYPYRFHFDATENEKHAPNYEKIDYPNYTKACNHHFTVNLHHPNNPVWDGVDMDLQYILEMLCDWFAVGQAASKEPPEVNTPLWWETNSDEERSCMSKKTVDTVNEFLYKVFKFPKPQLQESKELVSKKKFTGKQKRFFYSVGAMSDNGKHDGKVYVDYSKIPKKKSISAK